MQDMLAALNTYALQMLLALLLELQVCMHAQAATFLPGSLRFYTTWLKFAQPDCGLDFRAGHLDGLDVLLQSLVPRSSLMTAPAEAYSANFV